jgi:NADP-dependent aldehyde dehydrogenase
MISGNHYLAGVWTAGGETFSTQPAKGEGIAVCNGGAEEMARAAQAAEEAFALYSRTSRAERAGFLRRIAEEIDVRAEALTEIATRETALPEARLQGERGRTVNQLRLFADHLEQGEYLEGTRMEGLPDREPLPRPPLARLHRPVGPVAVFGASNFPLAFSTAGGDTASALAAGCPVVYKGHPAHPGTSEVTTQAIAAAAEACGMPAGVFSLVQSNRNEASAALVTHPLIQAVGFTGSLMAGRILFDLCASRPVPIPFFGELGSINPVFLLPEALKSRCAETAGGWAASLTMGVGQFCTNPGLVIAWKSEECLLFAREAVNELRNIPPQTMLTLNMADQYRQRLDEVEAVEGVECLYRDSGSGQEAGPALYRCDLSTWLTRPELKEEIFGPAGILVEVADEAEGIRLIHDLPGQLTFTLQMDAGDEALASRLLPLLERKAGRLLANGFPTGVEVCEAMVHGGPYPASTNFGATSVGTMAIRRFLRPVCYQNLPDALLPPDLPPS